MTPAETELAWCAYLAGLIDGEGCIKMVRNDTSAPFPALTIKMVDPGALQACHERYGGSFNHCDSPSKKPNHRSHWDWTMFGKRVIPPLKDALPFLLLKQEHAALALEIAQDCVLDKRGGGNKHHLPESFRQRREEAWHLMREMNQRGRIAALN